MARFILLFLFVALVAAAAIGIKNWGEAPPVESAAADTSGLVALPDGSTLLAQQGTVGRDLLDWLERRQPGQKSFELGGEEFVGRTAQLTAESVGRIPRLAALLRTYPDVDAKVIGHTDPSADAEADMRLSRERAQTLVQRLEEGGISPTRLSIEARGSTDPIAANDTPEGRAKNQRVTLMLTQGE